MLVNLLQDLISVLETENRLLKDLIDLGDEKQENINNAKEVANLAAKEQSALVELERADEERKLLFDALGLTSNPAEWSLQLEENKEEEEELTSLITGLADNLAALQSLNHINQQLLTESLTYVQFSLNLLLGDDNGATYERTGSGAQGKIIFDRKV